MQIQNVLQTPTVPGVESSFAISLASDTGGVHSVVASGRQLDRPLEFAAFAAAQIGEPCTSPVGSDGGAWHSLLGQILSRREPRGPSSNTAAPTAEFTAAYLDDDRRRALLEATCLGQTVPGEKAPEPAPVELADTRTEHERFLDRIRQADAEAQREQLGRSAVHLERTAVGRNVMKNSGV
jgi:hypothetical protein